MFESCDVVSGLGFPFAPSCGNFESSPSCSSVFFSSGGLPYSQVCHRIHGRYSGAPDAFNTSPVEDPNFPLLMIIMRME